MSQVVNTLFKKPKAPEVIDNTAAIAQQEQNAAASDKELRQAERSRRNALRAGTSGRSLLLFKAPESGLSNTLGG